MRLSKSDAESVKNGLMLSLDYRAYKHPQTLPNVFDGIWINDDQKRAYLRRLADKGLIVAKPHQRGWYKWNTYKLSADWLPF
jgi:hypothetical protein